MTGEDLGYLLQHVMDQGALDIYYTPVHMKKDRPAIQITTLTKLEDKERFQKLLLRETSTFGVRTTVMQREILKREAKVLKTEYGDLRIKCGYLDGRLIKVTPEFESVRLLTEATQINFHTMYNFCIGEIDHYIKKEAN